MNAENKISSDTGLSKNAAAYGLSFAIAAIVNAILVIAKESSHAVMSGMKRITGHHWTTHSLIVLVLFVVLGWIFSRANGGKGLCMSARAITRIIAAGAILGFLIIAGFYLIGD